MIICDLDGTLFNDERRRKFLPKGNSPKPEDFYQYHAHHPIDKPYEHVLDFLNRTSERIVFMTARPERCRKTTIGQLDDYLPNSSYELFMRPEDNKNTSPELKKLMVETLLERVDAKTFHPITFIDDRDDVLDTIQAVWPQITCMHPDALLDKTTESANVADILSESADIFRERNAVYKDNWDRAEKVMKALFGDSFPAASYAKLDIMQQIVSKLTRFAASDMKHEDSIKDLIVYCAIMTKLVREEK